MSDMPTSVQYRLGVQIGHLVVAAMQDGATYSDIIATLEHCREIAVRNEAFGIDFASAQPDSD